MVAKASGFVVPIALPFFLQTPPAATLLLVMQAGEGSLVAFFPLQYGV